MTHLEAEGETERAMLVKDGQEKGEMTVVHEATVGSIPAWGSDAVDSVAQSSSLPCSSHVFETCLFTMSLILSQESKICVFSMFFCLCTCHDLSYAHRKRCFNSVVRKSGSNGFLV